jgi:transcriptional regulator with XRE-family HTH domain
MSEITNQEIGKRLKALRELREMRVQDISKELGVNDRTYLLYEAGKFNLSGQTIAKLSKILAIDFKYFLGDGSEAKHLLTEKIRNKIAVIIEKEQEDDIKELIIALNSVKKPAVKDSLMKLVESLRECP